MKKIANATMKNIIEVDWKNSDYSWSFVNLCSLFFAFTMNIVAPLQIIIMESASCREKFSFRNTTDMMQLKIMPIAVVDAIKI